MSAGTRSVVAAVSTCADPTARISDIEARLLQLSGRANQSERNRLNRELWALQQHLAPPPPIRPDSVQVSSAVQDLPLATRQLYSHWQVLRPLIDPAALALCVRCGDGAAPRCRFHPDAKGFGFGSGRFDYGWSNLWDTPHDAWFCCGSSAAECVGCVEELEHTVDPEWWREYAHLGDESGEESDDSDDVMDESSVDESSVDIAVSAPLAAMEIS